MLGLQQAPQVTVAVWADSFKKLVLGGTARFFGVDAETEEISRIVWIERRKRLAIKLFGGIKDSEFPVENVNEGHHRHLTSELEGDKMVLKITRPPRNKDSVSSLAGQSLSWMLTSMMTRKALRDHGIVGEREVSRSYQPSTTGIAAYYAAEQTGGLAVCPPPLPRVPSSHHLHGESPAEEVISNEPLRFNNRVVHSFIRILRSSSPNRAVMLPTTAPTTSFRSESTRPPPTHLIHIGKNMVLIRHVPV